MMEMMKQNEEGKSICFQTARLIGLEFGGLAAESVSKSFKVRVFIVFCFQPFLI